MENRKKVLAYGATGSQGGPVARRLLEGGAEVRTVTRNPERAGWLKEAGAEVFEGHMGDPTSLRAASEGVDAVFLLAPFFTESPGDGATYGKNAIDAAREAGVRLLVWNASAQIRPEPTGNPGFDVGFEVLEHLRESNVPHVVLEPTTYMENLLGPWTAPELIREHTFAYPIPNEVKMQWVATEDVAAFAVEALGRPGLANARFKVCGPERLSGTEVAERFGQALGRQISFRPMPPEEFGEIIDRLSPGMGEAAARGYARAYENPEAFSTDIDLTPALEKRPVRLTTLEDWVRGNRTALSPPVEEVSA